MVDAKQLANFAGAVETITQGMAQLAALLWEIQTEREEEEMEEPAPGASFNDPEPMLPKDVDWL